MCLATLSHPSEEQWPLIHPLLLRRIVKNYELRKNDRRRFIVFFRDDKVRRIQNQQDAASFAQRVNGIEQNMAWHMFTSCFASSTYCTHLALGGS